MPHRTENMSKSKSLLQQLGEYMEGENNYTRSYSEKGWQRESCSHTTPPVVSTATSLLQFAYTKLLQYLSTFARAKFCIVLHQQRCNSAVAKPFQISDIIFRDRIVFKSLLIRDTGYLPRMQHICSWRLPCPCLECFELQRYCCRDIGRAHSNDSQ